MSFKFDPLRGLLIYTGPNSGGGGGDVISVNGQTGVVVLDKTDIGLDQVDNTSDIDKPVSTAQQEAIDLAFSNLDAEFKYAQVLFVDKTHPGMYVEDGSINRPFKTVKDAIDSISDATSSKKYSILIAPGVYSENSGLILKPYVNLTGINKDTVSISKNDLSQLSWSNSTPGRLFLKNISFPDGLVVINDDPTGISGCVLEMESCAIPSGKTLLFGGRGGGADYFQLRNDCSLGSVTVNSASTTIYDTTISGTLTLDDVDCLIPDNFGSAITATIHSNYINILNIESTLFDVYIDLWACNPINELGLISNSTVASTLNIDSSSYPLSLSTSGSPAPLIVLTSRSEATAYTPDEDLNWLSVPTQVSGALDELAARVNNVEASAISFRLKNDTGSLIAELSPVFVNGSGNMELVNITTIPNNVTICVVPDDVPDQAYSQMVFKGRILNITTSLSIGNIVYVDKNGAFSSNAPVVGVAGVEEGDAYIKIGVISENESNPSNKDLIVDAFIITRL